MTLPMCVGIAAHAEQLRQRDFSLFLSLGKQRKKKEGEGMLISWVHSAIASCRKGLSMGQRSNL